MPVGGLESVRIQFLTILEEIGKCQNRKVSELELFWHFPILTLSNSDTFQFWHFPVLTLSSSDTFQFWHFPILTLSNSDPFQFWHFPVSLPVDCAVFNNYLSNHHFSWATSAFLFLLLESTKHSGVYQPCFLAVAQIGKSKESLGKSSGLYAISLSLLKTSGTTAD